jgi:hypothetical protein
MFQMAYPGMKLYPVKLQRVYKQYGVKRKLVRMVKSHLPEK